MVDHLAALQQKQAKIGFFESQASRTSHHTPKKRQSCITSKTLLAAYTLHIGYESSIV
jgi:hypothetical protein